MAKALWLKDDTGTWFQPTRVYIKQNGVWKLCSAGYYKIGGAWERGYFYDVTPPSAPEMTLELIENRDNKDALQSRWITVGVRMPGTANNDQIKCIRVLTPYHGGAPPRPGGGQMNYTPDHDWANEPWSEWRYNKWGDHKDTSVFSYKQWEVNPGPNYKIAGDADFFFGAWAIDWADNPSLTATQMKMHTPKPSVEASNIIHREASFTPNQSGSWKGGGFQAGDLNQINNPRSVGLWLYGNQISDSITQPNKTTIKQASLCVIRRGATVDNGRPSANVYLFWTTHGTPSSLSGLSSLGKQESTKIGTLDKGEKDWFPLPDSFLNDLKAGNIKSLGLDYKSPDKADAFPADQSQVVATADNLKCGELHVIWNIET